MSAVDAGAAAASALAVGTCPPVPPMQTLPLWMQVVLGGGAFAGAIVAAIVTCRGWSKQTTLANHQADLNKIVDRHKVELGAIVQKELAADSAERATALERLKSWLSEDVQRRLDADRALAARDLEAIRSELGLLSRLRTTAQEKYAEIAASVLFTGLRYMDLLLDLVESPAMPMHEDIARGIALSDEYQRRWRAHQESHDEFRRASAYAEAYLPEEICQLFRTVWLLRNEIQLA